MNKNQVKSVDISSKYTVEINTKCTKDDANSGKNTTESILKTIQQQSSNNKKGE